MSKRRLDYLPSEADRHLERAWNPVSRVNDLTVKVSGAQISKNLRQGTVEWLQWVRDALLSPDFVFETKHGSWMYVLSLDRGDGLAFVVVVRPTGFRAFAWSLERADESGMPISCGEDRVVRRVKPLPEMEIRS